ncbi:MAG: GDSL-type esterase/lipase family protein [Suilimivivens sp.]
MRQILCFGDSNTWGLSPETHDRFPWGVRWTSLLQEKVKWEEIRILEEGLCGRTTVFEDPYRENRNGWKSLPVILETHNPIDGVVLMLGTNDCKSYYKTNAYQIAKGLERCIDVILKDVPAERILIVAPLHLGELVWKPEYDLEFDKSSVETSKQLYAEYQKITEKKNIRLLAASDYAKPSEIDQEHLNAEGHEALADAIFQSLHDMGIL